MSLVPSQSGFFYSTIPYAREVLRGVLELLPVAAFVFVSAVPTQALAFVEQIESSHRPLAFIIDPTLEESIMNVAIRLRSHAAQIPDAPKVIIPGLSLHILLTAYSSTPDQTDGNPFVTAAGTQVNRGTLAANFLPIGTQVRIAGQEFTVLDRLNPRYTGKLIGDKWVPTRQEALQFGVRVVELEILSLP